MSNLTVVRHSPRRTPAITNWIATYAGPGEVETRDLQGTSDRLVLISSRVAERIDGARFANGLRVGHDHLSFGGWGEGPATTGFFYDVDWGGKIPSGSTATSTGT